MEIINPYNIKHAKTLQQNTQNKHNKTLKNITTKHSKILQQNTQFEQAAANLLKLITKIDEDKILKPSFLAIITATEYAYKREDGALVLPLGLLKD